MSERNQPMSLTVITQDGAQRLIGLNKILSITFTVDARRGPLTLIHTKDQERLVFPGTAEKLFVRFAEEQAQLKLFAGSLT